MQPELWALRRELRRVKDELESTKAMLIGEFNLKRQTYRQIADLSERLAQRTRELKAARAKLKQVRK